MAEVGVFDMRAHDVVLSLLAAATLAAISWPYTPAIGVLPDTLGVWIVSYAVGFVAAAYTLFIFMTVSRELLHGTEPGERAEDD